jgi:Protein of unknown function (DUF2878)
MPSAARLAICFCLGALVGTLLDGIHVYGDVESYPDPDFGRWAWFVPLEFGLAGAAAGALIPLLERRVGPPVLPAANRIAELIVIVAAYLSTVVLDQVPVVATVALLALLAGRLAFDRIPGDWAYALIAAVAGPGIEAALSALGAFDYTDPDFAGIPMWLPALWANGGLFIRRFFAPVVLRAPAYPSRSRISPPREPT